MSVRIKLKIASYNVSAKGRVAAIRRLRQIMADRSILFVCTQESRWIGKRLPTWARGSWFKSDAWVAVQVWFRQGIQPQGPSFEEAYQGAYKLTPKRKIEVAAAGPTNADEKHITFIAGTVVVQRGQRRKLVVGSIHLVPSIQFDKADALSEDQLQAAAEFVQDWMELGYEVILVGDYNMLPNNANLAPLRKVGMSYVGNGKATHGTRCIDQAWATVGVIGVNTVVVAGHRRDDHRIPIFEIELV